MSVDMDAQAVLQFWFAELTPKQWWVKDVELDRQIGQRFGGLHRRALNCELFEWRASPRGRLAEVIVLDQFSRNIYRDTAQAFAADPLALALAQEAVRCGADTTLSTSERNFLYMPFMHSESALIHEQAVALFAANGDTNSLKFEHQHRDIILRFGRYPHRNDVLGRESSAEEREFLQQPGSSF